MKISVIIPCHNAGPWIGETLRSVAAQTLTLCEVILIDDASTDDSVAKANEALPGIRVIPTKFGNAASARNAGIEVATGDWIALLDADDVWYPNHLERAAGLLEGTRDVAFMANHHWLVEQGEILPIPGGEAHPTLPATAGMSSARFVEILSEGLHFGHSTVLYRRDRLNEVGAFDPVQKRRHDIDLWLRMIRDQTWAYDPEHHAAYRVDTPGSISKNLAECERFYLQALAKNREGYQGPAMDRLIRTAARRAMSLAFVNGTREEFETTRPIAWGYLPVTLRAGYKIANSVPRLLRFLIRMKRARFTFRTGHRLPKEASI